MIKKDLKILKSQIIQCQVPVEKVTPWNICEAEKTMGRKMDVKAKFVKNRIKWHCVLLRSERISLLRSFKECNLRLRSFFEFLATYETQKNYAFFS